MLYADCLELFATCKIFSHFSLIGRLIAITELPLSLPGVKVNGGCNEDCLALHMTASPVMLNVKQQNVSYTVNFGDALVSKYEDELGLNFLIRQRRKHDGPCLCTLFRGHLTPDYPSDTNK